MNFVREPYQDLIHDHLVSHSRAGLFAGIGLGKTASTLSAFRTLLADGAVKSMLVIAPMRVANLTWPNEIKKWDQFHGLKVERLRDVGDKPSGKAQVYLTNYERLLKTVTTGGERETLPRLESLDFCDLVVFDELTKAKNPMSAQIKALRPLLKHQRRWGLTGTPRPNTLLDLFAQVRLLDDGKRLSPSFASFRSTYFDGDFMGYNYTPKAGAEEAVYKKIHDLVLTLRSSDHLDIADTIEEDVEVALPECAKKVYKELERDLMTLLNGTEVVAINAAVLVGKLLQVTSGAVYSTDAENVRTVNHVHDDKLKALVKLRARIGENAIIFCNHIHERTRILTGLPGSIDAHTFKGDIEDAWNSGKIKHLVADPRGLGHGLNLQTGGRNTIWFSPCHSRELYDQANGRTARKGQKDVPRVYRLLCPGTIDDATVETLRTRGDAQSAMMTLLSNFRLQGLAFN